MKNKGSGHPRRRQIPARRPDHPRRVGAPHWPAPALRLSASWAQPARGWGSAEQSGARRGVTFQDRPQANDGAGLPAGPAGQAAEAVNLARDADRALDSVPGL